MLICTMYTYWPGLQYIAGNKQCKTINNCRYYLSYTECENVLPLVHSSRKKSYKINKKQYVVNIKLSEVMVQKTATSIAIK